MSATPTPSSSTHDVSRRVVLVGLRQTQQLATINQLMSGLKRGVIGVAITPEVVRENPVEVQLTMPKFVQESDLSHPRIYFELWFNQAAATASLDEICNFMDYHSKHIDRVVWKATRKANSYSTNVIELAARYPQIKHSLRISPHSLEYDFSGLNVRLIKKWLLFGIDEIVVPSSLINLSNVHQLINLLDSIHNTSGMQVRLEATSKTRLQGLSSIVKSRRITQVCHDIPFTADPDIADRIRAKIHAQRPIV